jgi:hypothetical protein
VISAEPGRAGEWASRDALVVVLVSECEERTQIFARLKRQHYPRDQMQLACLCNLSRSTPTLEPHSVNDSCL